MQIRNTWTVGILAGFCCLSPMPSQANPIEEERNRRLQLVGSELSFLSEYCHHFLSDNRGGADDRVFKAATDRGYEAGSGTLASKYDLASMKSEEYFFRTQVTGNGNRCEIHVSFPDGEDVIVAQAFGQQILNMRPKTVELLENDVWVTYTNSQYRLAYRRNDQRPAPRTQTLVFEKL